jgi:MoxR-like ATPase
MTLRVGLTGTLEGTTRTAFKEELGAAGAQYVSRPEEGLDLLVVGEQPLQGKVEAARTAGAEIVDLATLRLRLLTGLATDVPLADEWVAGPPSCDRAGPVVRVLDVVLTKQQSGPMTPDPSGFSHVVLDPPTVQLLRGIARAVRLSHPCLIEGDTSTSKTSSIRMLASWVGAEVVRLNLNGQTDTSELVGRYVPDGSGWRFAEGLVPRAMRNGWWVVLDEVNLAEPAVLERLNPCLERSPELVLTEGPGTRFGPGADVEVHPGFRVFATMNPAGYAGRTVLSEAWRDRFVSHLVSHPPEEADYLYLLRHALTGEHPPVDDRGTRWAPAQADAPTAGLSPFHTLLPRLAQLFAGLTEMTRVVAGQAAPLGVDRRERYVFSRRGLLGILDALTRLDRFDPVLGRRVAPDEAPGKALHEAVWAATVDRMRSKADRDRVALLVRSLGL